MIYYPHIGDKRVNSHTPNHRISLTDLGKKQALNAGERLVDLLEPDDNILFYTSPYKRTTQTTEGILESVKKKNIPYRVYEEPRLREQDFGNFQGTATEMAKVWKERAHYGHFFFRIPNGESAADVYDRIAGFNETLFRQFHTDTFPSVLVLVSHGIWCRVFLMKWFRWSYEKFESYRNLGHCEFLIMEQEQDSEKYGLLTPLRTWDDPPDTLLLSPTLERLESNKSFKSLRFRTLRVRDDTSTQKQNQKDALIKEAFIQAQKEEAENNGIDEQAHTGLIDELFSNSANATSNGKEKKKIGLSAIVSNDVLNKAKCIDETDDFCLDHAKELQLPPGNNNTVDTAQVATSNGVDLFESMGNSEAQENSNHSACTRVKRI